MTFCVWLVIQYIDHHSDIYAKHVINRLTQIWNNMEKVSPVWESLYLENGLYIETRSCFTEAVVKIRTICMPETCENWLGLVNICVRYAGQIREIYQVLPYSVDFKAPGKLWNPFSKCSFIMNKDLWIFEMIVKLESNLYIEHVNSFLNFWHCTVTRSKYDNIRTAWISTTWAPFQ